MDPTSQDVFTTEVDSTLYQSFPAANELTYSQEQFDSFRQGVLRPPGTTEDLSEKAFDYINNYAYVGFKRPEFVMKGRELNDNNGFHVLETIYIDAGLAGGGNSGSDIITNLHKHNY